MFRDRLPSDVVLLAKPIPDELAAENIHGLVAPGQPKQITKEQMELAIRLLYPECVFRSDIPLSLGLSMLIPNLGIS